MITEEQAEQIDTITSRLTQMATRTAMIMLEEEPAGEPLMAYQTAMITVTMTYCMEFPEHAVWFRSMIKGLQEDSGPEDGRTLADIIEANIRTHIVEAFPASTIT